MLLFGILSCGPVDRPACEVEAAVATSTTDSAVHVYYDKFEDRTKVESDWVGGPSFDVRVDYECQGGRDCQPPFINFRLAAAGDSLAREKADDPLAFLDVRADAPVGELIFLIDNQRRIDVGSSVPEGYDALGDSQWNLVARSTNSGQNAFAQATVPYSAFSQIATANSVELRLAGESGELSADQVSLLCRVGRLGG